MNVARTQRRFRVGFRERRRQQRRHQALQHVGERDRLSTMSTQT